MGHTITNSNTFLAYFNHIDKFFEVVLWLDAYMPFIEKVDRISQWMYPVSAFVRKYQHKLKYFWDLRNQVVHWFRLEQHHYLLASDYAVNQIKIIYERLTKPPTVQPWAIKQIPLIYLDSPMKELIALLTQHDLPALPVRNRENIYQETIFLKQVVGATLQKDFLDQVVATYLVPTSSQALFMASDASVYEIEWLFSTVREDKKHIEVVRITENWYPDETILWIITAVDLPKLDQEIIL